jgi:hypothetical protein
MQLSFNLLQTTPEQKALYGVLERLKKKPKCKIASEYLEFLKTTEELRMEIRQ